MIQHAIFTFNDLGFGAPWKSGRTVVKAIFLAVMPWKAG